MNINGKEKNLLSKEEKLNILQKYFLENHSQTKLRKLYDIKDIGFITNWIRVFNKILKENKLSQLVNQKECEKIIKKNIELIIKLKEIQKKTKDPKRITEEEKINILLEYFTTNISQQKLVEKYKLSGHFDIYRWKKQIKLKLEKKNNKNTKTEKRLLYILNDTKLRRQKYSKEFKQAVSRDYIQSNKSLREIAEKYKINPTQVGNWSNIYREMIVKKYNFNKKKIEKIIKNEEQRIEQKREEKEIINEKYEELQRKYELIKIDLEQAELERDINKKIIEVAERELKINIRKK